MKHLSHHPIFSWAIILSQTLLIVIPVLSSTLDQDQKTYYPAPSGGGSYGTPSSPPHGSGSGHHHTPSHHSPPSNCGSPPHKTPSPKPPSGGGGGYTPRPPTSGGGGYTPTPPSSGGGGGYTPTPPSSGGGGGYTPTPPSSGGGYTPAPDPPSSGGGGYYNPPSGGSPPIVDTPPVSYSPPVYTPPDGYSPPTVPIDPGTPTPDYSHPPYSCIYWGNHPDLIWGVLGWWGTVGGVFGVVPVISPSLSLQQALSNNRVDGVGSLYREGTASLLNSMIDRSFPYSTQQVKDRFVASVVSDKTAASQARLFKLANEGHGRRRVNDIKV